MLTKQSHTLRLIGYIWKTDSRLHVHAKGAHSESWYTKRVNQVNKLYTGCSFSAIISFQLCYNAGISFKAIIIAYYSFVFGHGLLFTFTIFPKDLPGSTQKNISNSESNEKHPSSSSDYCSNGSETDTNGQLKNLKSENMSEEAKDNDLENIQVQENPYDGGTISNKTSDEGTQFA